MYLKNSVLFCGVKSIELWNTFPSGNVERLHNDYSLINQYVIQKYTLSDNIKIPVSFDKEPLSIRRYIFIVFNT